MNVVHLHDRGLCTIPGRCRLVQICSALSHTALASGAADRRARAAEIEADIDHACELAALGPQTCSSAPERRSWDRRAGDRYVAEAVRRVQAHADELETLRRQAAQLDRLVQVS
jgi:hypothetical protein